MDCQEINRFMPLFIEDELTGDELSSFILHVKSCADCYEEIETNYLIREALNRLEDGESFNIHSAFTKKLAAYEKISGLHNITVLTRRVILLIAGFVVAIGIVSLYL